MKTCPSCKRNWEDDFRMCPIDGTPLRGMAGSADPNIGRNFGQCRVIERIAEGDLGPIYRAEEPRRGTVAVQITPPDRLGSPILVEAFGDAVKLAAKVNHPNVIRVYGMETAPDGPVAVLMELVSGMDLASYKQNHPGMDLSLVTAAIRQIAEGLLAAHRGSMMHGALHPGRIMIGPDGTAKVGGFHRSGVREGVDVFSVTPDNLPYLSPEHLGIVRDLPAPDYRADVYGLGVVLYELLASRLPYEANSLQDLATLMEGSPPLPPNFANPLVSPLLSRVVLRAISKHPSDRHGSMDEFIRELDAARQPAREPHIPAAQAPVYSPKYPEPSSDLSLFPRSTKSGTGIFSATPSDKGSRDSVSQIFPSDATKGGGSEDSSFFGWFKSRVDNTSTGPRKAPGAPQRSWDDPTFAGPKKGPQGDFTERTVVVTGKGGRGKSRRRSFSETFTNFRSRDRDQDLSQTGFLPRRRYSKAWLVVGAGVLLLAILGVLLFFLLRTPKGELLVYSNPPGAQILYCVEPCQEANFRVLSNRRVAVGNYRVRIQMEGYESREERYEVTANNNEQKIFELISKLPTPPISAVVFPDPQQPPVAPPPAQPTTPAQPSQPSLAVPFENAVRMRNFFPDTPNNALHILQRWQQSEAGVPSPELMDAWQKFCIALDSFGKQKLGDRDFAGVRQILDQIRTHIPGGDFCAASLQSSYEKAVENDKGNLLISARSAMERTSFVTPEQDNALKYIRQISAIDPNDRDAKQMESEIFTKALEKARAAAGKRQHQEALEIFTQLKVKFANPPGGIQPIQEAIDLQTKKLQQFQSLQGSYSLQVKHHHGRSFFTPWNTKECNGVLRVDGFYIEFKSAEEVTHSFKVAYEGLKDVKLGKEALTLFHPEIRPEGKMELQETVKNSNPGPAQLYAHIMDYKVRNAEYMK